MAGDRLPLEGITIADFSWVLAGPRATEYLGAMGAQVIKIEGPYHPDPFRSATAPMPDTDMQRYSATFWSLNYSKLGCTIDIMQPKGRALALEIVKRSDIVLENYAYGVMEKAGLDYDNLRKVKPDIIMVSGSAVGKTGPSKTNVAYGSLLNAFSGVNSVTGYEGEEPGALHYTDPLTGATFVMAVLAALWHKKRTGEGQFVDISMAETTIDQIPEFVLDYTVNGRLNGPQGNKDGRKAPNNSYCCRGADSWLAISVGTQTQWQRFSSVLGNPPWTNDERFADQFRRWKNRLELDKYVEGWTLTQDAATAMDMLQKAHVPAGACHNNKGVLEDSQLNARQMFVRLEQEIVGYKPILRLPWLLDPGPNGHYFPAPQLGEHNNLVLQQMLGLSDAEIKDLRKNKVIL